MQNQKIVSTSSACGFGGFFLARQMFCPAEPIRCSKLLLILVKLNMHRHPSWPSKIIVAYFPLDRHIVLVWKEHLLAYHVVNGPVAFVKKNWKVAEVELSVYFAKT